MSKLAIFRAVTQHSRPEKLRVIFRPATQAEITDILGKSSSFRFIERQEHPNAKIAEMKLSREFGAHNGLIDPFKQKWSYVFAGIEDIRPESLVEINDHNNFWKISFLGFPSTEVIKLSVSAYKYLTRANISENTFLLGMETLLPGLLSIGQERTQYCLSKNPLLLEAGLKYRIPLPIKENILALMRLKRDEAALLIIKDILADFLDNRIKILPYGPLLAQGLWIDSGTATIDLLDKMIDVFTQYAVSPEDQVVAARASAKLGKYYLAGR